MEGRDVAKKMLSRLINKPSRLFWTVQLQKYPIALCLVKFQPVICCLSDGEISWQLTLSYIPGKVLAIKYTWAKENTK